MKNLLGFVIVILFFSYQVQADYKVYQETLLGTTCERMDMLGNYGEVSNLLPFESSGENIFQYVSDGKKYVSFRGKSYSIPSGYSPGGSRYGDNTITLYKRGTNNVIEISKYGKKEYEVIDIYDGKLEEGTFIFFGRDTISNEYVFVSDGEVIYTSSLPQGAEVIDKVLFSEDGKHFLAGFKEEGFISLVIDGKITQRYKGLSGTTKNINNSLFSYIALLSDSDGIKEYGYFIGNIKKLSFEYHENEKVVKVSSGLLKGSKYDPENFYMEFVDNNLYIFGIKANSSILEVSREGKLVSQYNDIVNIGSELLSEDAQSYSLIVKRDNGNDSLLSIINSKISLHELQFSHISRTLFLKEGNSVAYVGSERGNNEKKVSVVQDDRIIATFKDIIGDLDIDEEGNLSYTAKDFSGMIDIEGKSFLYNGVYSQEGEKGESHIFFDKKKIFSTFQGFNRFSQFYHNNGHYIIAGIDTGRNLVIYKDGVYFKVKGIIDSSYHIRSVGMSKDGMRYYVVLYDNSNKQSIIVSDGKIIYKGASGWVDGYKRDFGSMNYSLHYASKSHLLKTLSKVLLRNTYFIKRIRLQGDGCF